MALSVATVKSDCDTLTTSINALDNTDATYKADTTGCKTSLYNLLLALGALCWRLGIGPQQQPADVNYE